MKAIFIGGPLHGQTKIVDPTHNRIAWREPITDEHHLKIVEYRRRWMFDDVGIFCTLDVDSDQQLVKSIELGLQLQPEPPMRWIVERLQRCGEIIRNTPEEKEFLCKYLCKGWEWEQNKKQKGR